MADNEEPETKISLAEQMRLRNIDKLMRLEGNISAKNGTYHTFLERADERRKELGHYTITLINDTIEEKEQELNGIRLGAFEKPATKFSVKGMFSRS